jgi:hypothetical protein
MFADYKCITCGHIDMVKKEYDFENNKYIDYPLEVNCTCECSTKMTRQYSTPVVDVCEGMYGNSKNGYSSKSSTYIPSKFSPMNAVYGKYGRTAGVETENG